MSQALSHIASLLKLAETGVPQIQGSLPELNGENLF